MRIYIGPYFLFSADRFIHVPDELSDMLSSVLDAELRAQIWVPNFRLPGAVFLDEDSSLGVALSLKPEDLASAKELFSVKCEEAVSYFLAQVDYPVQCVMQTGVVRMD